MAAPDRIAIGKGLRRPWTMIAAEVLSWMQVLYFVLFSSVDGFCGWALFVACTLWFAGISLAIHNGRWKGASFFLFSEWFLLTFFLVLPKTGTRFEYYLLVAFCFLLPCVLLWLPPSIRWCVRRNLKDWVIYFAGNPLSRNWFDIVDPSVVLKLATIEIGKPEYLADRKAIKEAFKAFGLVVNVADGSAVSFPAASAGKMLYQSGVDIRGVAGAFKSLFESSIRVWNEREVPMEGHKFHFNVGAYRNYLNKFTDGKGEYYIRFTVREIGKDSSVHASTISEVAIYEKNEGARTDSHPENPEDGSKAPFTDNKIALYLSYVNGGWK